MSWVRIHPDDPVTFPPAERLVLFAERGAVYGVGLRLQNDDDAGSSWYGVDNEAVADEVEQLVDAGRLFWHPVPIPPAPLGR